MRISTINRFTFLSRTAMALVFEFAFGRVRVVDIDEGNYLFFTRLILEGSLPYRDFLYPQMPLTSFVYAAWTALVGASWIKARILSALLTALIAALFAQLVDRRFDSRRWGWTAFAAFILAAPIFQKYPLANTYAIVSIFAYLGFLFLGRMGRSNAFWGGLFMGLAASTRLFFWPVLLLCFAWLFWYKDDESSRKKAAFYSIGVLIGLSPAIVMFLIDPQAFCFGNLFYHSLRVKGGLFGSIKDKMKMVLIILTHPQYILVLIPSIWAAVATLRSDTARKEPLLLSTAIGMLLFVEYLFPNPTFYAYYSSPFLFFITGAILALEKIPLIKRFKIALLVVFFVFGLVHVAAFRWHRAMKPEITLDGIWDMTDRMMSVTHPGDLVISQWPGYLWTNDRKQLRGIEELWLYKRANLLSKEERRRYHVLSNAEIVAAIKSRKAPVIIWSPTYLFEIKLPAAQVIRDAGYVPITNRPQGVNLYVRKEDLQPQKTR